MNNQERAERIAEAFRQTSMSMQELTTAIEDRLVPALREAYRQFAWFFENPRVRFELWVADQPWWQRPLMRFAYWVERQVLR